MKRAAFVCLLLAMGLSAETQLDRAFIQLYNNDFANAHRIADEHIRANPDDAVGYGVRASAYLFQELDRLGILESDFFASDKRIAEKKKLKADPGVKARFDETIATLRAKAQARLSSKSNDQETLFAMALGTGLKGDYMALIEKRQFASWAHIKESNEWAQKLLRANPNYTDAYLTSGMTEYIVGSMPFFLRWMVKVEGVEGSKNAGIVKLQKVAESGRYFKPFAKILLALCYVREKKFDQTYKLLAELNAQFPRNPSFKRELEKIAKARAQSGASAAGSDGN